MYQAQKEIAVNKKDEFFIAIGKQGLHSFVMLGVMQENKPIILARVGKTNAIDKDFNSTIKITTKVLFSHTKSELQGEPLPHASMSYSAYTIGYSHYLQFLKLAGLAQGTKAICAYQPVRENEGVVFMERQELPRAPRELSQEEEEIFKRSQILNIYNSCRSTAIDLLKYTQNISKLTTSVSKYFFRDLSVSTKFSNGVPNSYFYVFPLPPTAYKDQPEKAIVLTKIYKRMENLIKKEPSAENTIQKFCSLKALYNQQAGIPHENLDEALNSIRQWKEENKKIISELRGGLSFLGKFFAFRSSTKSMADTIEESLAQQLKKR